MLFTLTPQRRLKLLKPRLPSRSRSSGSDIPHWLARDEEIQIIESRGVVARMVPPIAHTRTPKAPDYVGMARAISGVSPDGTSLSEIVRDSGEPSCGLCRASWRQPRR